MIAVEGSLRIDTYDKEDGTRGYKTYILASNIQYLSTKSQTNDAPIEDITKTTQESNPFADFGQQMEISDEELPF